MSNTNGATRQAHAATAQPATPVSDGGASCDWDVRCRVEAMRDGLVAGLVLAAQRVHRAIDAADVDTDALHDLADGLGAILRGFDACESLFISEGIPTEPELRRFEREEFVRANAIRRDGR